ncbi:putative olfactory receptor 13C6 [Engraulis encrasicolus]|uniref:putative olfactory receptor 13C6 n=1 Tax=Engraulis encrasicolus TaxID=184585 RepID=UPI002FD628DC
MAVHIAAVLECKGDVSGQTVRGIKAHGKTDIYLFIILFLQPYILIVTLNACLIYIVCKNRSLHEPMYIFIANLSVNGIYGGTALLPHTLSKLATQSYDISLAKCLSQVRLKRTQVRYGLSLFLSVYLLIMPPLLNPVVYGSTALKNHIVILIKRAKLSPIS